MTVTYEVGDNLYVNLTNRCPCACVFCIRTHDDGAYGSDPLWLEHEPTFAEIRASFEARDMSRYREIVFCGYGEPLMRFALVCEVARWLREQYPGKPIRLNTNGLCELYAPQEALADGTGAAEKLAGCIDKVSVSLNAGDAACYDRVTCPSGHPTNAYETMLRFAAGCKARGIATAFTVVDVLTPEETAQAVRQGESMGIPVHVRAYID
ncbi:MAG: radical SAM protein [Oscillospiraceae bacterium]|nr:radical SAM protein [Oscillospiraceae bacterium]